MRNRAPSGSSDFFGLNTEVDKYENLKGLTASEEICLLPLLVKGRRFLDLGIGAGRTTAALHSMCSTYVGIDIVPEMVARAKEKYPGIDLRVGDASDLSEFDDGSFDVVLFSFNGLDCLEWNKRQQALREIRRVLVASEHFVFSSHDPRSFVRITKRLDSQLGLKAFATTVFRSCRALLVISLSKSFWTGSGYRRDLADPIRLYHGSRRAIRKELEAAGFEVVRRVPSEKWSRPPLSPRWWYYVCQPR